MCKLAVNKDGVSEVRAQYCWRGPGMLAVRMMGWMNCGRQFNLPW